MMKSAKTTLRRLAGAPRYKARTVHLADPIALAPYRDSDGVVLRLGLRER